jgi:hypothetical protein
MDHGRDFECCAGRPGPVRLHLLIVHKHSQSKTDGGSLGKRCLVMGRKLAHVKKVLPAVADDAQDSHTLAR